MAAMTIGAMVASVGLASAGAFGAVRYFRPRERLAPRPLTPRHLARARLRLHRIDLTAFVLAGSGVLSLVPETMQAFAPELMYGTTLAGSALDRLDYVAFVFVSISFGMGIARRALLIALEKASLHPCP
ncbi:hypothetical protein ASE63_06345 [Bosea sp. Root381]|uniref:hypothetical protein n=1 Tax=Bosea sp. Root381 TaxID=1736524 RepID=UPI0006FD6540|nr:hypothetical protein [Bosea sp. Root381]KRE05928.1 hypothetical protein ASE63_06345 [Bosea sp. Root381]